MKIIITAELDEDSGTADPDDSTGLTENTYNAVISTLSGLGFDDIEVMAHDGRE